jgi:ribonuclease P protein component
MRRDLRLRKNRDFQRVYSIGRSWSLPTLVLRAAPNELDVSRFGFVVSKRLGGAVIRNRLKRQLREIARQQAFAPGFDLVFIARKPLLDASFGEMADAVSRLRARLEQSA